MSAVEENSAQHRFELPIDGTHEVAAAYYRIDGDKVVLTHTIVPERFSGQGLGSQVAHGTFEAAFRSVRHSFATSGTASPSTSHLDEVHLQECGAAECRVRIPDQFI